MNDCIHVSVFQVASMIEWGETFLFHCMSREFQLEQPKPSVICQHGNDRRICDAKVQKTNPTRRQTRPTGFATAAARVAQHRPTDCLPAARLRPRS